MNTLFENNMDMEQPELFGAHPIIGSDNIYDDPKMNYTTRPDITDWMKGDAPGDSTYIVRYDGDVGIIVITNSYFLVSIDFYPDMKPGDSWNYDNHKTLSSQGVDILNPDNKETVQYLIRSLKWNRHINIPADMMQQIEKDLKGIL